jgi:chorismate mutase
METEILNKPIPIKALCSVEPLIISGPCSAESEKQVIQIAREIAALNKVHILRAGIWKPRTKPGMFEGIGVKGLSWLLNAKLETGLPTSVEVASAKHVEQALSFEVDVLWIGARTTVNPFAVQEIADALKGVEIPVLIKNPINPDIELWSGAIERLAKCGLTDLGLIHRGFSSYGNTTYRNSPLWHLALEMKRRFSEIPIICDPSHICGNRELLAEVSQKAINLGFNGLMIESHSDPDNAWSDAKQQITPRTLFQLLEGLIWREETTSGNVHAALESLREQINEIDSELLSLLGQRMKIAGEVGNYKKENNITVVQTNRWNEILKKASEKGKQLNLSKEFIHKYFEAVHLESIAHQESVLNS